MKIQVKLSSERILFFTGVLVLIGMVFFICSFLKWLNYDSLDLSSQADVHSTLVRNKTHDPAVSNTEHSRIERVDIGRNPFIASGEEGVEAEPFPELCFTGLILGERRLAIVEETAAPYRSWILQEGDGIFGARVIRIDRRRIEFSRNGETIILQTPEGSTAQ